MSGTRQGGAAGAVVRWWEQWNRALRAFSTEALGVHILCFRSGYLKGTLTL